MQIQPTANGIPGEGSRCERMWDSLSTVVTMKNINSMNIISGMDAVGISEESLVLRENFIS